MSYDDDYRRPTLGEVVSVLLGLALLAGLFAVVDHVRPGASILVAGLLALALPLAVMVFLGVKTSRKK